MIAADLAVAPRIGACEQLLKLILFQRYLLEFLNNFVNLSQLFTPGTSSLLQAGMLVMDGRNFTLVSIVKNVAEHKAIVKLSDICVIYLDASTGKPDAQKTMKLAVAVTSGNIRNLFINKHGIFFSADGELWDAKIIDLVQQPVSISEALRMPFYKFGEFIGNQADRFFSARSQEAQKQLETNFNAAATAATAPQAAAAPKMPDAGCFRFDAADGRRHRHRRPRQFDRIHRQTAGECFDLECPGGASRHHTYFRRSGRGGFARQALPPEPVALP